jgi:hypothetical protein
MADVYTQLQQALDRAKAPKLTAPFSKPQPVLRSSARSPLTDLRLPPRSGYTRTLGGGGTSRGPLPDPPSAPTGGWRSVLGALDVGRSAIASTLKETIDQIQFWTDDRGFSYSDWWDQTRNHYGFQDLIRDERTSVGIGLAALAPLTGGAALGWTVPLLASGAVFADKVWADRVLGFVGDVAIDPLTYMGGYNVMARNLGYKGVGLQLGEIAGKSPNEVAGLLRATGVKIKDTKNLGNRAIKIATQAVEVGGKTRTISGMSRYLMKQGEVGQALAKSIGIDAGLRLRVPFTGMVSKASKSVDDFIMGAGRTISGQAPAKSALGRLETMLAARASTTAAKTATSKFSQRLDLRLLLDKQRVKNIPTKYKVGTTDKQFRSYIKKMRTGPPDTYGTRIPVPQRKTVGTAARAPVEFKIGSRQAKMGPGRTLFGAADFPLRALRNLPISGSMIKPLRLGAILSRQGQQYTDAFKPETWRNLDPKIQMEMERGLVRKFRDHFSTPDKYFDDLLKKGDMESLTTAWRNEQSIAYGKGVLNFYESVGKKGVDDLSKLVRAWKIAPRELNILLRNLFAFGATPDSSHSVRQILNRNSEWFKNLPENIQKLSDDQLDEVATVAFRMMNELDHINMQQMGDEYLELKNKFSASGEGGYFPRAMSDSMSAKFNYKTGGDLPEAGGAFHSKHEYDRMWTVGKNIELPDGSEALREAQAKNRVVKVGNKWYINDIKNPSKPFVIQKPSLVNRTSADQVDDVARHVFGEPMYSEDPLAILRTYYKSMGLKQGQNALMGEAERLGYPVTQMSDRGVDAFRRMSNDTIQGVKTKIDKVRGGGQKGLNRVAQLRVTTGVAAREDLDAVNKWLDEFERRLEKSEEFMQGAEFKTDIPELRQTENLVEGIEGPSVAASRKGLDDYVRAVDPTGSVKQHVAAYTGEHLYFDPVSQSGMGDEILKRIYNSDPEIERIFQKMFLGAYSRSTDFPEEQLLAMYVKKARGGLEGTHIAGRGLRRLKTSVTIDDTVPATNTNKVTRADAEKVADSAPQLFRIDNNELVFAVDPNWAKESLRAKIPQTREELKALREAFDLQIAYVGRIEQISDELTVIANRLNEEMLLGGKVSSEVDDLLVRSNDLATEMELLRFNMGTRVMPQINELAPRIRIVGESLTNRAMPVTPTLIQYWDDGARQAGKTFNGLKATQNDAVNIMLHRIVHERQMGDTMLLRAIMGMDGAFWKEGLVNTKFQFLEPVDKRLVDEAVKNFTLEDLLGLSFLTGMTAKKALVPMPAASSKLWNVDPTLQKVMAHVNAKKGLKGQIDVDAGLRATLTTTEVRQLKKMLGTVRKELKRLTVEALEPLDDKITVYGYGELQKGPSYSLNPAYDPYQSGVTAGHLRPDMDPYSSGYKAFTVNKKDVVFAVDARGGWRNAFGQPEAELLINPKAALKRKSTPVTLMEDIQNSSRAMGRIFDDSFAYAGGRENPSSFRKRYTHPSRGMDPQDSPGESALSVMDDPYQASMTGIEYLPAYPGQLPIIAAKARQLKLSDETVAMLKSIEDTIEAGFAKGTKSLAPTDLSPNRGGHFQKWEDYYKTASKGSIELEHNDFIGIGISGKIDVAQSRQLLRQASDAIGQAHETNLLKGLLDPDVRQANRASLRYRVSDATDEEIATAIEETTTNANLLFDEATTYRDQAVSLRANWQTLYGDDSVAQTTRKIRQGLLPASEDADFVQKIVAEPNVTGEGQLGEFSADSLLQARNAERELQTGIIGQQSLDPATGEIDDVTQRALEGALQNLSGHGMHGNDLWRGLEQYYFDAIKPNRPGYSADFKKYPFKKGPRAAMEFPEGGPEAMLREAEMLDQMALVAELEAQSLAREAASYINLTSFQRGIGKLRATGADIPEFKPPRVDDSVATGWDEGWNAFFKTPGPEAVIDKKMVNTFIDTMLDGTTNWGPWRLASGNKDLDEGMIAAAEAFQRMNSPVEVEGLLKAFDTLQNFLKAGMISTPGFVMRNIFGAFFNAWLDGVNPKSIFDSMNTTKRIANHASDQGMSFLEAARSVAQKEGTEYMRNYVGLLERGVRGGGQATVSVDIPLGGAGWRQSKPSGLKNLARGQVMVGADKARAAEMAATSMSPLSSNFVYYQMVRSANMQAEDIIRLGVGLDSMRWGGDFNDALARIAKTQFDYSDLTEVEKKFWSRAMPFYTWTRKNVPYQFQMLGKHPAKYNAVMNAKRNLEWGTGDDGVVPDYLLQPFGIRMPFEFAGSRVYSVPDLPFQDLFKFDPLARTEGEIGNPLFGVETMLQNLAWQATPIIKTPIEVAFGKKLASGVPMSGEKISTPQPLRGLPGLMPALASIGWAEKSDDGEWMMADHIQYIVLNSLPALGTLRRMVPSEAKYQQKFFETMFSSMAGLSLRRNTPQRQENYKEYLRYKQYQLDREQGALNYYSRGGMSREGSDRSSYRRTFQ